MKLMALRYAGNCVACGVRLEQRTQAWYDPAAKAVTCTSCQPIGAQLSIDVPTGTSPADRTPVRATRTDRGKGAELEQKIAHVFEAHGYRVQTNLIREGRGGTNHEIDVLAEKTDDLLTLSVAIECKAWANPIEKDVVSKFADVCHDLGIGHALIVSLNGSRPGATAMASQRGVTIWGTDEIARHLGNSSMLNLQNRPVTEEVGLPRVLDVTTADQLIAKETSGTLGIGREEVVWHGDAWIPVAVVHLTLRKYGLRRAITGKEATSSAWAVYDLIGGTFVTRLDGEPDRAPLALDGPKLDQLLKLGQPGKDLETIIGKWDRASADTTVAKYRKEMDRLGIPDMHTATVGESHPFLYPVRLAITRFRNGSERVVAIDAHRGRLDQDLGRELSKQIASVRTSVAAP